MRRARRFLFVFSDTGGGHRSTACAVLESLKELRRDLAEVELVDGFAECAHWPLSCVGDIYPQMLRLGARPWSATFHLSDGLLRARLLARTWWPVMRATAMRLVSRYQADAIVSFHPMFNDPLLRAVRQSGRSTPVLAVVTDLIAAHAFWYSRGAACWLVPTEDGRRRALAHGLPPERVVVTGLPVRPRFCRVAGEDKKSVRRRLGIPQDLPLVLLMSGANGLGPVQQLSRAIGTSGVEAQLAVIAGRNRGLESRLAAESLSIPMHVRGFIEDVHEWMRAADLVVTKAGPSTISEALVVGTPLVISSALPGQEPANVRYVVNAGAAVWAPSPDSAAAAVRSLLGGSRRRLVRMAARALAIGRPNASRRAAEITWKIACGVERQETAIRPSGLAERPGAAGPPQERGGA